MDRRQSLLTEGQQWFPPLPQADMQQSRPMFLPGYGVIIGRDDLLFDHMSEEHGVIIAKDGGETGLKVGDTLYIVPNHICTSINLCNFVWIKEKDGSYTKTAVDCRGMFN